MQCFLIIFIFSALFSKSSSLCSSSSSSSSSSSGSAPSMRDRRKSRRNTLNQITEKPATSAPAPSSKMDWISNSNEEAPPFTSLDVALSIEARFAIDEISNEHVMFYAFDDLFPGTDFSDRFDSTPEFRQDIRAAAREDFYVTGIVCIACIVCVPYSQQRLLCSCIGHVDRMGIQTDHSSRIFFPSNHSGTLESSSVV